MPLLLVELEFFLAFIIHNTNTISGYCTTTSRNPQGRPEVLLGNVLDCTPEEQYVLSELQEHTRITDRNAF